MFIVNELEAICSACVRRDKVESSYIYFKCFRVVRNSQCPAKENGAHRVGEQSCRQRNLEHSTKWMREENCSNRFIDTSGRLLNTVAIAVPSTAANNNHSNAVDKAGERKKCTHTEIKATRRKSRGKTERKTQHKKKNKRLMVLWLHRVDVNADSREPIKNTLHF